MAFCFKKKESLAKGIRRLGRKRIEEALECLKDCRQTEAIHCVRKEIKKARAVLRLVQIGIGKRKYRQLNKRLREAANHLSPMRDAHVNEATLKNLARHFRSQLDPRALRHVRAALRIRLHDQRQRFVRRKTAAAVTRLLPRAAKDFDQLTLRNKGWRALCPGVKAAYRKGRRAYHTVLKQTSPENFHEWRKRVKDLWYHVRILRRVWPEQMDAVANELKILGEHLGEDHDLFMLQHAAEKQDIEGGSVQEFETLCGLIEQRQRELRRTALAIGARFHAEKPSAFSSRLGQYWRRWRREKGILVS